MPDFTKLAEYLNSFDKESPSYDLVCFIKDKIAQDFKDNATVNNGEEEELDNNDVTMSTPEQQTSENIEGELMSGAFKELDVQNKIQDDKEKVHVVKQPENSSLNMSTNQAFGDNAQNQKQASLYDALIKKFRK
jgi:hypothetical protein